MSNIISCKMCGEDFDYVQNISGSARPLCDRCRKIADTEEVAEEIEKEIKSGNRYVFGPDRKNEYDPSEILLEGKFPKLESDADKYVCVIELASFIERCGFAGGEDNVIDFLNYLDSSTHRVLFSKQLGNENLKILIKRMKDTGLIKEYQHE